MERVFGPAFFVVFLRSMASEKQEALKTKMTKTPRTANSKKNGKTSTTTSSATTSTKKNGINAAATKKNGTAASATRNNGTKEPSPRRTSRTTTTTTTATWKEIKSKESKTKKSIVNVSPAGENKTGSNGPRTKDDGADAAAIEEDRAAPTATETNKANTAPTKDVNRGNGFVKADSNNRENGFVRAADKDTNKGDGFVRATEVMQTLEERKWLPYESLETFAKDITELVQYVYQKLSKQLRQDLVKDYFIKGLDKRLQVALVTNNAMHSIDMRGLIKETKRLEFAVMGLGINNKGGFRNINNNEELVKAIVDKVFESIMELKLTLKKEEENNIIIKYRNENRSKGKPRSKPVKKNSSVSRCGTCRNAEHAITQCPRRYCRGCGKRGHDLGDTICASRSPK